MTDTNLMYIFENMKATLTIYTENSAINKVHKYNK